MIENIISNAADFKRNKTKNDFAVAIISNYL